MKQLLKERIHHLKGKINTLKKELDLATRELEKILDEEIIKEYGYKIGDFVTVKSWSKPLKGEIVAIGRKKIGICATILIDGSKRNYLLKNLLK
jgi:hypothetical protein